MTLCVKAFVPDEASVFWKASHVIVVKWHTDMYRVKNAVSSNRRFFVNVVICCEVLLLLLFHFWWKFYCHCCLIFWNLLQLGFCQNNKNSICSAFHEAALWGFLCVKIDILQEYYKKYYKKFHIKKVNIIFETLVWKSGSHWYPKYVVLSMKKLKCCAGL